jgi:hypothetical protein
VHLIPRGALLSLTGFKAGEKGSAKLHRASAAEPIQLEVSYEGVLDCDYTAASFVGVLTFEPAKFLSYEEEGLRDLNIVFTRQKVAPVSSNSATCPKKVSITAPFGAQNQETKEPRGGFEWVFGRLL